jgi:hypothetical protein
MLIEFIHTNEILQIVLQVILVFAATRIFFILGIVFTVIAVNVIQLSKTSSGSKLMNQPSSYNAFEIIFLNFLTSKSKPFLLNKVY